MDADTDLPRVLSEYVMDALTRHRARTVIEFELYLAALRRLGLASLIRERDYALPVTLIEHTDPETARAIATVLEGVDAHVLIHGRAKLDISALPLGARRGLAPRRLARADHG